MTLPVVEIHRNPSFVLVNGYRIETAPAIRDLLRVIGTPTRSDTGPTPAPAGHRNNALHVFDSLGLHVNEHHHTRRAQELTVWLNVGERRFAFTPSAPFAGKLLFGGSEMPLDATEAEFLEASPWPFAPLLKGHWSCTFDGFCIGFDVVGNKLGSGRRSKRRQVVDVSLSWPHDPWDKPASVG